MGLANLEPATMTRPDRVTTVIAAGAPARDALEPLFAVLAREAIDATVVAPAVLLAQATPVGAVVVTWPPLGDGAVRFEDVVAWGRRVEPAVGLIAVVGDGDEIGRAHV